MWYVLVTARTLQQVDLMECGRSWAELEHPIPIVNCVLRNLRRIRRHITFSNYDSSTNVHSICHDGTVYSKLITEQSIVATYFDNTYSHKVGPVAQSV